MSARATLLQRFNEKLAQALDRRPAADVFASPDLVLDPALTVLVPGLQLNCQARRAGSLELSPPRLF
jgi:hypothetical protein